MASSRFGSSKRHVNAGYAAKGIIKMILKILIGVIALVALFYFGVLATTSVRYIYTDSYGFVLTKDPKIKEGRIPAGTLVLAQIGQDTKRLDSIGGKLTLAATPQYNVSGMTIIGGPDGRITYDGDYVAYNGKTTKVDKVRAPENVPDKGYLNGQYWAICADKNGACKYHQTYILNEGDIIGQVHDPTEKSISEVWDTVQTTAGKQGVANEKKVEENEKNAQNEQKDKSSPIINEQPGK